MTTTADKHPGYIYLDKYGHHSLSYQMYRSRPPLKRPMAELSYGFAAKSDQHTSTTEMTTNDSPATDTAIKESKWMMAHSDDVNSEAQNNETSKGDAETRLHDKASERRACDEPRLDIDNNKTRIARSDVYDNVSGGLSEANTKINLEGIKAEIANDEGNGTKGEIALENPKGEIDHDKGKGESDQNKGKMEIDHHESKVEIVHDESQREPDHDEAKGIIHDESDESKVGIGDDGTMQRNTEDDSVKDDGFDKDVNSSDKDEGNRTQSHGFKANNLTTSEQQRRMKRETVNSIPSNANVKGCSLVYESTREIFTTMTSAEMSNQTKVKICEEINPGIHAEKDCDIPVLFSSDIPASSCHLQPGSRLGLCAVLYRNDGVLYGRYHCQMRLRKMHSRGIVLDDALLFEDCNYFLPELPVYLVSECLVLIVFTLSS